ncbi:MAG: hypothetical protein CMG33_01755 [Candidatus Marinimicrobia bacterium]|nr:hypothetical protein [Candidatus Neomarinimicrobiota bacterium]
MEIRGIQIDGFGVFSNRRVNDLASGLNVIYGPNEFGKTTLLEFIRRMLFGFPRKSQKINQYQPIKGGSSGGVLKCALASGQLVDVIREAGNKDGPIIRMESVENRGQPYLDSLLGYATTEVFKNLYAFTIDELHDIQSLRGEEIKSRVYGVGMGLGEVSLREIEQEVDKTCGEIFKSRGQSRMDTALREINEVEKEIMQAQENLEKFNELTNALSRLDDEKSALIKTIDDLELTKKFLETRQELFPVVIEILSAIEEIDRMGIISNFPENGMSRLASIQLDRQNVLEQVRGEERTYDELKISLHNLVVNDDLLKHEGDILFLQQSLKEVQSVIEDKVKVKNEREHINAQIIVDLGAMGKEWTEERIMGFELSEAEKKESQEFYNLFSESRQGETSALDKLNLHREQKEANEPESWPPLSLWKRVLPYGLGGVGFVGIAAGGIVGIAAGKILETYIFLGTGFVMVCLGALLRNKILVELKREEEPEDKLEISLLKSLDDAIENRETVFKAWRSWLSERDLDQHLSPLATEKLGDKASGIKIRMAQREGVDERLSDMTKTIEEVSRRVEKIAPSLKNYIVNSDIPTNIQVIGRHYDEARLAKEKKENLEIQCRSLVEKVNKLKDRINEKNNELSEFLRSADAADENNFIEKNNIVERKRYLDKVIAEKKGYVQSRVGLGDVYDEFVASIKLVGPEENSQKLDSVSEKLSELSVDKDRLLQAIGETRARIDHLSSNEDMSKKQIELEMDRQKIKECAREWVVNKVALHMLGRARKKYEKERQPSVIKAAEEIFTHATQGSYTRIFKPMDSDDIFIVDENERSKGLLEMSRGTREQLYLAMRFGLITEYEKQSEPLLIVMDDVFVNFDDDRNDKIIDRVRHFAEHRQIIVLTCHRRTLEAYSDRGANALTIT